MCPGVDLNVFGFPSRVFIFRGFKDIVWQYPQRTTFSPKISQCIYLVFISLEYYPQAISSSF